MSKFFKEVDFNPQESEPVPVEIDVFPEAESFRGAIEKYHTEVGRIQVGRSNLVQKAIHFPKGICLPSVVLDRFYADACRETLTDFLESCKQEFGITAAREISKWFAETYPKAEELLSDE